MILERKLLASALACLLLVSTCPQRGAALEGEQALLPLLGRLFPQLQGQWEAALAAAMTIDGDGYRLKDPEQTGDFKDAVASLPGWSAHLPVKAGGRLVLQQGPVRIEEALVGAWPVPALAEQGLLRYPSAYPDTEVLYAGDGSALERLYYLSSAESPRRFTLRLSIKGGRLELGEQGEIALYDESGQLRWRQGRPLVLDSDGRQRAGDWLLRGGEGEYLLTLAFEPKGLVYPLLID